MYITNGGRQKSIKKHFSETRNGSQFGGYFWYINMDVERGEGSLDAQVCYQYVYIMVILTHYIVNI